MAKTVAINQLANLKKGAALVALLRGSNSVNCETTVTCFSWLWDGTQFVNTTDDKDTLPDWWVNSFDFAVVKEVGNV